MDDSYFNLLSLKHRDESGFAESLRWRCFVNLHF